MKDCGEMLAVENLAPPSNNPEHVKGTLFSTTKLYKISCNKIYGVLKFFSTISFRIIASLEEFFYWLGFSIAARPYHAILGCLLLAALFSTGLINFQQEKRPEKLWIPQDSSFIKDSEWMRENFPSTIRPQFAIFTAANVLDKQVLLQMLDVIEEVQNMTALGKKWEDVCFKISVVKFNTEKKKKKKRQISNDPFEDFSKDFEEDLFTDSTFGTISIFKQFDPSVQLSQSTYCSILDSLEEACWLSSVLDIWSYDRAVISNLSQYDILEAVNSTLVSPTIGIPRDYIKMLGAVEYDESGKIVKAGSAMITWFIESDPSSVAEGDVANDAGTGDVVDKGTLAWEAEFIKILGQAGSSNDINVYYFAGRSFGDISGETIKNDAQKLSVGFMIMFIYVQIMLGRFNLVEQRAFLSLIGIASIAIGCVVAYGICSAFHVTYGPVHNILPFLMLGIGIDDMFVIVQCWNNLTPTEMTLSIQERVGLALKHAGVSITITSLTDFTAFAIGATTVLPSLRSFCIYAAVGILATYILQATFFVAWFSLDQRRIESNRDGFLICFKHKNYTPNACSQQDMIQKCFNYIFGSFLFKIPAKIFVLATTVLLLCVGTWGLFLLRQEFDPIWFLPQKSYLYKYFMNTKHYYPGDGEMGTIYLSGLNHNTELYAISTLVTLLNNEENIVQDVDSWITGFEKYVNTNFEQDVPLKPMSDSDFSNYLGRYLFSPSGSKYRRNFKFKGKLLCLKPAPYIETSSFEFKFKKFKGSFEHVPAMNRVKEIVKNLNFSSESGVAKVWARAFAGWETDEVIAEELYRNILWAMGCVFITTLILIANLVTCVLVLICVVFTLVDVGGMMHFWGLTIDVVSCIDLVLAIGLCVDYAAHIGHTFMTCQGTRDQRAMQTVKTIGPAVLNGGLSTFLAFILLANSDSHVFTTYFKIFFLVVVFGLFHGLLFFPVVLSLIGPAPYHTAITDLNGATPSNAEESTDHNVTIKKSIAKSQVAALQDDTKC